MKDEYARAGVPMLPVVRGEAFTRRQIVLYTLMLIAITIAPVATGLFGGIYLGVASVLGLAFLAGAIRLQRTIERRPALQLYLFSLAYLAVLFAAMAIDTAV
jgi:protoheme IX farnesyltransferase